MCIPRESISIRRGKMLTRLIRSIEKNVPVDMGSICLLSGQLDKAGRPDIQLGNSDSGNKWSQYR